MSTHLISPSALDKTAFPHNDTSRVSAVDGISRAKPEGPATGMTMKPKKSGQKVKSPNPRKTGTPFDTTAISRYLPVGEHRAADEEDLDANAFSSHIVTTKPSPNGSGMYSGSSKRDSEVF